MTWVNQSCATLQLYIGRRWKWDCATLNQSLWASCPLELMLSMYFFHLVSSFLGFPWGLLLCFPGSSSSSSSDSTCSVIEKPLDKSFTSEWELFGHPVKFWPFHNLCTLRFDAAFCSLSTTLVLFRVKCGFFPTHLPKLKHVFYSPLLLQTSCGGWWGREKCLRLIFG